MAIELHRSDIDHESLDIEATLSSFGLSSEQRLGVEAVAALKADLYNDPERPRDEQLQECRRWDIVSCLLGVNWKDPEVLEGLAAGVSREHLMRVAEADRDRLIKQAERIGDAIMGYLVRSGVATGDLHPSQPPSLGQDTMDSNN
jgi:hypothetical protein